MGHRLSKIYTRTGDKGTTGLGNGERIDKFSPRVEAMGDVDELNSLIGLLLTEELSEDIRNHLNDIQHALFDIGGELSIPDSVLVKEYYVKNLEQVIDQYNQGLPPLKEFILPGGGKAGSVCHLARAVCRRAERKVVRLGQSETINANSPVYLNRLSDLLFVFARVLVRRDNGKEVYWEKDRLKK